MTIQRLSENPVGIHLRYSLETIVPSISSSRSGLPSLGYIRPTTWYPDLRSSSFSRQLLRSSTLPNARFHSRVLLRSSRTFSRGLLIALCTYIFLIVSIVSLYIFHAVHPSSRCTEDAVLQFLHFPLLYRFFAIN